MDLSRLHLFSYANTVDDELQQIEKRTVENMEKEKTASKARRLFLQERRDENLAARRARELIANQGTGDRWGE